MAFYPEATFLNCFCISREDLLPLKYQTIRITVYLYIITVYLLFTVFYYLTKPDFPITIRNLKELNLNSADGLFQNKVVLLTWCFLLGCHICLICVVMSFQWTSLLPGLLLSVNREYHLHFDNFSDVIWHHFSRIYWKILDLTLSPEAPQKKYFK